MSKSIFSKPFVKDKTARSELRRAHSMIVLLSIALIVTLGVTSMQEVQLDPLYSVIVMVLLGIVALISLGVMVTIGRKK
jgi:hypothetical protein